MSRLSAGSSEPVISSRPLERSCVASEGLPSLASASSTITMPSMPPSALLPATFGMPTDRPRASSVITAARALPPSSAVRLVMPQLASKSLDRVSTLRVSSPLRATSRDRSLRSTPLALRRRTDGVTVMSRRSPRSLASERSDTPSSVPTPTLTWPTASRAEPVPRWRFFRSTSMAMSLASRASPRPRVTRRSAFQPKTRASPCTLRKPLEGVSWTASPARCTDNSGNDMSVRRAPPRATAPWPARDVTEPKRALKSSAVAPSGVACQSKRARLVGSTQCDSR